MQVVVAEHEELLLAALRDVQALGSRRTADGNDGGLDQIGVFVDDGRVEVLAAPKCSNKTAGREELAYFTSEAKHPVSPSAHRQPP